MGKDPAVLFYTSDFLTGTMLMTYEQKGKYITLLCLQHQKGSLSEKDMLNICSSYDEDIWRKFRRDGEKFYNDRMRVEAEKRAKYSESRRVNKLKGIENKKVSDKNSNKNESTYDISYDKHMENENENINEIKDVVKIENINTWPTFENFWDEYDKKVDMPKSKVKWGRLSQKEKELIMAYIPAYKEAVKEKQYRKNPTTFLNNRSWENEIIKTEEKKNTISEYLQAAERVKKMIDEG